MDWQLKFKEFSDYIGEAVVSVDVWIQLAIIFFGLAFGFLVRRVFLPKVKYYLSLRNWHLRLEAVIYNICKLSMQVIAISVIFVASQLVENKIFEIDTQILKLASSLITAWILIRLFVQFIENNALRQAAASIGWFIAALSIVGVLDETTQALDAVGINMGDFRLSALTVIKGVVSIFAFIYIASFISSIIDRKVTRIEGLTPSSKVLISKISRVTLLTFAILIGITSAGVDLSLLAVFSGAVGLGIGFGLQKVVSNLFSGMLLLLDNSIKPGDIIQLDETFGWVDKMGARYTSIVTRDNKAFLIPNEDFVTQRVVNWSHGDTFVRTDVVFGVDYGENPHKIIEIATEAARKPERVCKDPVPMCHFAGFGDSSLDFKLRFWISDAENGLTNIRGEVLLALWDAFTENNVKIPYPHREIIMRNEK